MAQFGGLECERCLWQKKRVRKGVAVEKFCRSKAKNFSGTARVSCVAVRKVLELLSIAQIQFNNEVWLSLVERCVRDAEAAGSSPVTSTKK